MRNYLIEQLEGKQHVSEERIISAYNTICRKLVKVVDKSYLRPHPELPGALIFAQDLFWINLSQVNIDNLLDSDTFDKFSKFVQQDIAIQIFQELNSVFYVKPRPSVINGISILISYQLNSILFEKFEQLCLNKKKGISLAVSIYLMV